MQTFPQLDDRPPPSPSPQSSQNGALFPAAGKELIPLISEEISFAAPQPQLPAPPRAPRRDPYRKEISQVSALNSVHSASMSSNNATLQKNAQLCFNKDADPQKEI